VICYFDSSAFVKLLVPERGSDAAIDLWTGAERLVSSILLYPEGRAALARASRAGRVRRGGRLRARQQLETLWGDVETVNLNPILADRAGDLAELHALRGFDAVHLATAEAVADRPLAFVAADQGLCAAARGIGLSVAEI